MRNDRFYVEAFTFDGTFHNTLVYRTREGESAVRLAELWGAIKYRIGSIEASKISVLQDHKGHLTVFQKGLMPKDMVAIHELWVGEPINESGESVSFVCNCCDSHGAGCNKTFPDALLEIWNTADDSTLN